MIAFHKEGHRVLSLSQADAGSAQETLDANGIETHTHFINRPHDWWYQFLHCVHFIRFCRAEKIDVVYSHLESPSLVSVLAQYFIPAKVIICRHHNDLFSFYQSGLAYRIIYSLAKQIIVVSNAAKRYMIKEEKIPEHKILVIPLAYDFSTYGMVDNEFVKQLKQQYPSRLRLITVGQLITIKKPELSIEVLKKLVDAGIDTTLFIVGAGDNEALYKQRAAELGLQGKVIFTGYVSNVLDFITASDVLLHPSVSESSCVVIKEAALLNKPMIVCKGVGDFDEYLLNGTNSFVVNSDQFVAEAFRIIHANWQKPMLGIPESPMKILSRFDVNLVVSEYKLLNGD